MKEEGFIYTKWVCSCKPAYGKSISPTSAWVYDVQGHDRWFHSKKMFILILGTGVCIIFFFSFHIISTCWILTIGFNYSNGFLLPYWWLQTVFQFWYVLTPFPSGQGTIGQNLLNLPWAFPYAGQYELIVFLIFPSSSTNAFFLICSFTLWMGYLSQKLWDHFLFFS